MTKDLKEAQIVVGIATNDCNALLETIASSTTEVESKQTIARSKEQQLQAGDCLICHHFIESRLDKPIF